MGDGSTPQAIAQRSAQTSDSYSLTLHTLALRQPADAEALVAVIHQETADVQESLEHAVAKGTVVAGKAGFRLTSAGREHLAAHYPQWFAAFRADGEVGAAMNRFETGVNRQVLKIMTQWQLVEAGDSSTPNLHDDADYDARILDRLSAAHERVQSVLAPLARLEPMLEQFFDRLGAALERADHGELDFVSGVRVASFHTVWFQLHEHVLRVTGRKRPA